VFANSSGLTSVTIPDGVTEIYPNAFSGCSGLITLSIPDTVMRIDNSAFRGCSGLISVSIPDGVSLLADSAFEDCRSLTSVTIPQSVTTIGSYVFAGCDELSRAAFLGDAPNTFQNEVFANSAPDFTIFHLSSSTGFTPQSWNGYQTTEIDESIWPAASWLLGHGFWYDTDLQQDTNCDGVSLLMSFALGLDPNLNLSGKLPSPVVGKNTLSLRYREANPGISYRLETSNDLQGWTTEGVILSGLDPDNFRTASVLLNSPHRFLRLVVEE
jgi:hypothetical protein